MAVPTSLSGGCLCGAVDYSCAAPPLSMVNCHCRDCQKWSGGTYSPTVVVPAESLEITDGQLRSYTLRADSGAEATRQFCPACGSQLFAFSSARPERIGIKAGSLDDPRWFKPTADVWVSRAQPWDTLDATIAKISEGRPAPHQG